MTSYQTPLENEFKVKKPRLSFRTQDRLNLVLLSSIACGVIALLLTMLFLLFRESSDAISQFGLQFITDSYWDPAADEFGGLAFLFGTAITSLVAVLLAGPVSVAIALFINEILPKKIGHLIGLFVEMIAAIPSIVFGLWGLFYLAPWVNQDLTPFLRQTLGFLPLFQGPSFGIGILSASLILALMIVPTITSICKEVFKTVPTHQKEAALALGSTRFEMLKMAVLSPSFSGIVGATALGLGRALGETMAVAMVIGNSPQITASLFAPAATMASVIANEYAEADSSLHVSALCLVALFLFCLTFLVNFVARTIVWKNERRLKRGI